jgi:hypothetical protein
VDPRVIVIIKGGVSIGEDRVTPRKTTKQSGVRKLQRRNKSLIQRKRSRHLKRQEKSFEEIKILHQRYN